MKSGGKLRKERGRENITGNTLEIQVYHWNYKFEKLCTIMKDCEEVWHQRENYAMRERNTGSMRNYKRV